MGDLVKLKQPGSLGVEGQKVWDHLTENIPNGILHPVDSFVLFSICQWWEIWLFWVKDTDDPYPHRAYRATCMAGMAYKHLMNAAKDFGLTPDLPHVRGFATTYEKIGKAFGETARAIGFWRRQGAPIIPRGKNDLAEIDDGELSTCNRNQWLQEQATITRPLYAVLVDGS